MSAVQKLSSSQPLTYEWLNSLADAINKVTLTNEDDSNVKFDGLVLGEDVLVVTGEEQIEYNAKSAGSTKIQKNISFNTSFLDNNIVVVATITAVEYQQTDTPIPAAVAVGEINKTSFDAAIKFFNDSGKFTKGKLVLRYVAIGKRAAS
jgi:hypothetical protein